MDTEAMGKAQLMLQMTHSYCMIAVMKSMGTSITGSILCARKLALYTALATTAALFTAQADDASKAKEQPSTNEVAKVKFVRPSTGAPSVRLTGGSRGIGD